MEFLQKAWPAIASAICLVAAIVTLRKTIPKTWSLVIGLGAVLLTCALCVFLQRELESSEQQYKTLLAKQESSEQDYNTLLAKVGGGDLRIRHELKNSLSDLVEVEDVCDSLVKDDSTAVAKYLEVLGQGNAVNDSLLEAKADTALHAYVNHIIEQTITEFRTILRDVHASKEGLQDQIGDVTMASAIVREAAITLNALEDNLKLTKPQRRYQGEPLIAYEPVIVGTHWNFFGTSVPLEVIERRISKSEWISRSELIFPRISNSWTSSTVISTSDYRSLLAPMTGLQNQAKRWINNPIDSVLPDADSIKDQFGPRIYAMRAQTRLTECFNDHVRMHIAMLDSTRQAYSENLDAAKIELGSLHSHVQEFVSRGDSLKTQFVKVRDSLKTALDLHHENVSERSTAVRDFNTDFKQQFETLNRILDLHIVRLTPKAAGN